MSDTPPATLRDIADAAGVSVAAASKVLNNRGGVSEENRQRVLAAADQLGYQGRSARAIQRAGVGAATIIMPAAYYSDSLFYEDIVKGVLEECAASGLSVEVRLVAPITEGGQAEIESILADPASGAIIAIGLDDAVLIDRIAAAETPAVLINGMDRSMRIDSVLPDNWSAGWLATQRLLAAGHRQIMHVTLPHRLTMRRRLDGFRVALTEAGLGFDPDRHVLDLGQMGFAETQTRNAIIAAHQQGRLEGVTAFFCSSDMVAFGLMQGLQSLGFAVPDDFSVIGLDDVALAGNSRPPLTTMRIERAELGRSGASLLLGRITNPGRSAIRMNMGVELIERATVAPPRGNPGLRSGRAQ
ncbi:LacI family DNA-binding transcriptional regulator [Paracoccus litorisediminis]|nr:LacI family DNA-binding transcriptional regulator [Paracoccus litorisediminis]